MNEAERIREVISQLTGARFEIRKVENLPPRFEHAIWFMRCREITQANKIPYVNSLWRQDADIWMESLTVGNTLQLIELTYGEEAAAKSTDMDYSDFESKKFQIEFGDEYPLIFKEIQRYKSIAEQVSKSRKVQLELRKEPSEGIVEFTFAAKMTNADTMSLEKNLQVNVEALKEAYRRVAQS